MVESVPLRESIDRLWNVFGGDSDLIPTLAADALMARATTGELKECLPRLLQLASAGELGDLQAFEIFDMISEWGQWPPYERNALLAWADAWWLTALSDHPNSVSAVEVLGELTHLGVPMNRWLDVWRDSLDGPASLHLADAILQGQETDAWATNQDERGQLVAWAQGEPIVMGITLVGGVHLEPERLGEVLDVLLG